MCYDISFTVRVRELADYFPGIIFDTQIDLDFGDIDHIQGVSVFGRHPIIYMDRDDKKLHCRMMEWSCIEFYAKEEPAMVSRNGRLNIRSERILQDSKSYWYKIRNRRCLIPVTGIMEHREISGWKKKVPYIIRPKEQPVFFLPGLYSVAEIPEKTTGEIERRWTFGLITRSANGLMTQIHNSGENKQRMPLFLPLNMSTEFISEELGEERYREILDFKMKSTELLWQPIYTIRSPKPRPDNFRKIDYYEWPNLPDFQPIED